MDRRLPVREDGTFEIWLAWSERTIVVAPGTSTLDALSDAGVHVERGCLSGACGECAMPYVEGDLVHKDSCLSLDERVRNFCPCVSRARSRIVLAA